MARPLRHANGGRAEASTCRARIRTRRVTRSRFHRSRIRAGTTNRAAGGFRVPVRDRSTRCPAPRRPSGLDSARCTPSGRVGRRPSWHSPGCRPAQTWHRRDRRSPRSTVDRSTAGCTSPAANASPATSAVPRRSCWTTRTIRASLRRAPVQPQETGWLIPAGRGGGVERRQGSAAPRDRSAMGGRLGTYPIVHSDVPPGRPRRGRRFASRIHGPRPCVEQSRVC